MDAAIIEKEALQLPDTERALLADRLLSSLTKTSQAIKDSWAKEAHERLEAHRRGEIEAVDGPEAISDLKKRFGP